MQRKEIILHLSNRKQGNLYNLFTQNEKIPAKTLRRKIGRRQYDNFKELLLVVNEFLETKGIPRPILTSYEEKDGRVNKYYSKNPFIDLSLEAGFVVLKV